jgi:hypothetical protein
VVLLVLLATTAIPVQGGDVFQCPDGKGGIVWSDILCAVPAPHEQPPAQTPSPGESSHTREEAVPPAPARAASPPLQAPEPQSSDCLSVQSIKAHTQSRQQRAVELAWEVAVQNRCKQSVRAVLIFTIYGNKDVALDSESTKIVVSADGVGTINGIMRVSRANMRRMSRYDAKLSVL